MWIRKTVDVLVMTLLLLGPAVLLSKLEDSPGENERDALPEIEISGYDQERPVDPIYYL